MCWHHLAELRPEAEWQGLNTLSVTRSEGKPLQTMMSLPTYWNKVFPLAWAQGKKMSLLIVLINERRRKVTSQRPSLIDHRSQSTLAAKVGEVVMCSQILLTTPMSGQEKWKKGYRLNIKAKNKCKRGSLDLIWRVIPCWHTNSEMSLWKQSINLLLLTWARIQRTQTQTPIKCLPITACYQLTSPRQFPWTILPRFCTVSVSSRHSISTNWSNRPKPFRMFGTFSTDQREITQTRFSPNPSSTSCASWWTWTTWSSCQTQQLSREIAS